jgi:hypothetical protein
MNRGLESLEGAEGSAPGRAGDTESINSIVLSIYESVSFRPGASPDWERLRSLFFPGALIVPPKRPELGVVTMDIEGFIERFKKSMETLNLERKGFIEAGIAARVDSFGAIAHVFSTYEARNTPEDAVPFLRGINSIQLLKDGGRYWVLALAWDVERDDNPLPARYLPGGE